MLHVITINQNFNCNFPRLWNVLIIKNYWYSITIGLFINCKPICSWYEIGIIVIQILFRWCMHFLNLPISHTNQSDGERKDHVSWSSSQCRFFFLLFTIKITLEYWQRDEELCSWHCYRLIILSYSATASEFDNLYKTIKCMLISLWIPADEINIFSVMHLKS